MKRLLLIVALTLLASQVFAQKAVELGVYSEWRGDNCLYKSARPFFIIQDRFDLERFWSKANADEGMPAIDFDKYMLLVWSPGPTMFDYRPVEVERFLYQNGFYIVVMNIERKDTGGFWRRPFLATLLTKKKGDIYIMRRKIIGTREEWKPLYTIWDMSGERERPFTMAKIDKPAAPTQFIEHAPESPQKESQVSVAQATTQTETVAAGSVARPTTSTQASQPASGFEDIFGSPTSAKTVAKAEKKAEPTTGASKETETVKPPEKQPGQPSFSTIAEDPLFGSEFDIEF